MMATVFLALALLALAAAVASWVVAVIESLKRMAARRAAGQTNAVSDYVLLVAFPFLAAPAPATSGAGTKPSLSNKATVAFFVALTLAVAATSAYTNLTMKRPTPGPASTVPAAPGATPSKS